MGLPASVFLVGAIRIYSSIITREVIIVYVRIRRKHHHQAVHQRSLCLHGRWQPYLKKWAQTPDPIENGLGSVRHYENQYMGRRFTNAYEVTIFEPNKRVMYESTPESAVQASGGTSWETGEGGMKVTFIFKPQLGDF